MSDTPPTELEIFWHALYYLRDPRRYSAMSAEERNELEKKYSTDQILTMYDAIQWAIAHPSFGFVADYKKHMPPEPPMLGDDAAILDYFKKIEEGMRPVVQKLRPAP
jgi:hypothetical protein